MGKLTVTDPALHVTVERSDIRECLIEHEETWNGAARVTSYVYDARGNLDYQVAPGGNRIDVLVPFHPLTTADLQTIARRQLEVTAP